MKRKFITVLLFLVVGFLLTGCDLFGGKTTTETATTTTTQQQTTTTTTTQSTVSQSTSETYYTVVFLNGDGTTLNTQTVLSGGTAATPTTTPTKVATAQYTYVFDHWDQSYSNVTSNMTINPVFTPVLQQYTVTFKNYDGTVLKTQTVDYGSAATAPTTTPTKPSDAEHVYVFDHWDVAFNNITGNLIVTAVFASAENYDTLLEAIVVEMFDPDDVDEQISELMGVMDASTSEELYNMLFAARQVQQGMMAVEDVADLQALYASLDTLGFDKDTLIDILFNLALNGMTNDINHYTEEIARLEAEIDQYESDIATREIDLTNQYQAISDYCAALDSSVATICMDYANEVIDEAELYALYSNLYYTELPEAWDDEVFWELANKMDDVFWETYVNDDSVAAAAAQAEHDALWDALSTEEQDLYGPVLDAYINWGDVWYHLMYTDEYDVLWVDDGYGVFVMDAVSLMLYGDYDDYGNVITDGYFIIASDISSMEWMIVEDGWWLEDLQNNLAQTQAFVNYMNDPTGEAELKALAGSIYDSLEAVILSLDQDMMDYVLDIMNQIQMLQSMDTPDFYYYSPYQMIMPLLSVENIDLGTDYVYTILNAFFSNFDAADYANLKAVALGIAEEMWFQEGKTSGEVDALLTKFDPIIDRYITYIQFASGEFLSLIDSMDATKIADLLALVPSNGLELGSLMTEVDLGILAAQAAEILIGDDSFDINTAMQYLAAIYFDISTEFNADGPTVIAAQASIDTFMTDLLDLVGTVSGYNPSFVTAAQVEDVYTMIAMAMQIPSWFQNGFTGIDDPVTVYYSDYLYGAFDMLGEDVSTQPAFEAALLKYETLLGTSGEEETFYTLQSFYQYALGVFKISDFADLSEWVGNLETLGYTQEEIVGIIMTLVSEQVPDMSGETYSEEYAMDFLLYDIFSDPTNEAQLEAVLNLLLDDIQNMVTTMPDDSFEVLFDFIAYMTMADGHFNPDEFDLTPARVYDLVQDLSTFLQLRAATLDSSEITDIETFVTLAITLYVDRMDLDPMDAAAEIALYEALFDDYIGLGDMTLTEITNVLDALTLTDVEDMMAFIEEAATGQLNMYQLVIEVAGLIDGHANLTTFDLIAISDQIMQTYYDQENSTEHPVDLTALQDGWETFITDTFALITTVAAYDPAALDPGYLDDILAVQQRVEFLTNLVMNQEAILTVPTTWGYDPEMLNELINWMFQEEDEFGSPIPLTQTEIDDYITQLCAVFEIDPVDGEQLYFILLGVAEEVYRLQDIHSLSDALEFVNNIQGLGFTDEEIATYLVNLVMTYLYPQLPDMYDSTDMPEGMPEVLYAFLTDTDNQALLEDMIVMILGQLDAYHDATYIADIDAVIESFLFMKGDGPQLDPEMLVAATQALGTFMTNMFSTLDSTDEATIVAFATALINAYGDVAGLSVLDLADYLALLTYIPDLMDIPGYLGDFLLTVTEDEVNVLFQQIMILGSINGIEEPTDADQVAQLIAIANILNILAADDDLDYVNILTPLFGLTYDINVLNGHTFDDDNATMTAEVITMIGQILTQSAIVADIDPNDISPSDNATIVYLVTLVNNLRDYLGPILPGPGPEPTV
ncbi:MAG: hypothetical protein JXB08_05760 [Bacilli bacterium]|nr:hypothetical protein [Bacilli bacterium]